MENFRIHLVKYHQSFELPRTFIQTQLPESLLAQALTEQPDLKELHLTHPDASPPVFECLVQLATGIEPTGSKGNKLQRGDRYLNLPLIQPFYQRAFKNLPNRADPNADINKHFIRFIIRSDNLILFMYLVRQGLAVTKNHFKQAIGHGSHKILKYLLVNRFEGLPLYNLLMAVRSGREASVAVVLDHSWLIFLGEPELAFRRACFKRQWGIARLLVDYVDMNLCFNCQIKSAKAPGPWEGGHEPEFPSHLIDMMMDRLGT